MKKGGRLALIVGLIFLIILVVILFFYFALIRSPVNEEKYTNQESDGGLKNPASNLTIEEAKIQFNESFVYYLLYEMQAYNLHNPPLSQDNPKMEIIVDEESFNAKIEEGNIYVKKGSINNEDILITTSREEAIKMLKSKEYVGTSFQEGGSGIELKAGKTTLFSKGYLGLYQDLTGNSVTGSAIRIYTR